MTQDTRPNEKGHPTQSESSLFSIMTWGTVISFGLLGSAIYSTDHFIETAKFKLDTGQYLSFGIGAFIGWIIWFLLKKAKRKG